MSVKGRGQAVKNKYPPFNTCRDGAARRISMPFAEIYAEFPPDFRLLLRPQTLLRAAIVKRVSASIVSDAARRFSSSSVSLLASVLAAAVMEAVSSQEFTVSSPPCHYMNALPACVCLQQSADLRRLRLQSRFSHKGQISGFGRRPPERRPSGI